MKSSPKVTVIGLGPGEPSFCSAKNLTLIEEHEFRYVRTTRHPSSCLLGPDVVSFDYILECITPVILDNKIIIFKPKYLFFKSKTTIFIYFSSPE